MMRQIGALYYPWEPVEEEEANNAVTRNTGAITKLHDWREESKSLFTGTDYHEVGLREELDVDVIRECKGDQGGEEED